MIDIHLSSLNRSAGQILPDLPGLFAATPPKRTARGRDRDALVIHISPIGTDEALSTNRIADLLNAAAERFYKSAGSITSALTEAADFLNTYFIDINKNLYPSKAPCTAGLNILVIRGDLFFNACAGQSACLIVRPGGVEKFGGDTAAQTGLGVGRSVQLRFAQSTLLPGDILLFSPTIPAGWTESVLPQTSGLGFEEMYKSAGAGRRTGCICRNYPDNTRQGAACPSPDVAGSGHTPHSQRTGNRIAIWLDQA